MYKYTDPANIHLGLVWYSYRGLPPAEAVYPFSLCFGLSLCPVSLCLVSLLFKRAPRRETLVNIYLTLLPVKSRFACPFQRIALFFTNTALD
jgi:hypothetical protein